MCESRAVGGEEEPRREVRRLSSRSLMMYTAMNKSHLLNTSLASLYVEWRYQIDDFALLSDRPTQRKTLPSTNTVQTSFRGKVQGAHNRSEEHTSELQS